MDQLERVLEEHPEVEALALVDGDGKLLAGKLGPLAPLRELWAELLRELSREDLGEFILEMGERVLLIQTKKEGFLLSLVPKRTSLSYWRSVLKTLEPKGSRREP